MSSSVTIGKLRKRLHSLDWRFIQGSAILSAGSAVARLLAMLYWLILARVFTPDDYGFIQYAITLGTLATILAQPVGQHVFARYVGQHRDDAERLPALLTNLLAVLLGTFTLSLAIAIPALAAIGELNAGVIVVFAGTTLFYAYWGLANGLLFSSRLTLVYLVSNLIQLAATFAVIDLLGIKSALLALLIYGCSYLPAIALLQHLQPLPLTFRPALLSVEMIKSILRFSWPVWISHIAYTITLSLPILLLNSFTGKASVGIFSLGTTLSAIFGVVSLGLSTQLMPTIAGAPRHTHIALLKRTTVLLLGISVVMMVAYLPVLQFVVPLAFGDEYLSSFATYLLLMAVAVATGMNGLLTAVLVGSGRVGGEAVARLLSLAMTGLLCWLLIPPYGVEGAAAATLIGVLAAIVVNTVFVLRRPTEADLR